MPTDEGYELMMAEMRAMKAEIVGTVNTAVAEIAGQVKHVAAETDRAHRRMDRAEEDRTWLKRAVVSAVVFSPLSAVVAAVVLAQ